MHKFSIWHIQGNRISFFRLEPPGVMASYIRAIKQHVIKEKPFKYQLHILCPIKLNWIALGSSKFMNFCFPWWGILLMEKILASPFRPNLVTSRFLQVIHPHTYCGLFKFSYIRCFSHKARQIGLQRRTPICASLFPNPCFIGLNDAMVF